MDGPILKCQRDILKRLVGLKAIISPRAVKLYYIFFTGVLETSKGVKCAIKFKELKLFCFS